MASDISLAAGANFEQTIEWAPAQSGAVTVQVDGMSDNGEAVSVASEELTITTQDASQALVLDVTAQAQTTTIYSEPAVVRFAVQVKNIGQTDAATLTVKEAGTTVATIPSLPSGESRTLVFDLETSIAGQIQFVVSGKDAAGNDKAYDSNVIELAYVADPRTDGHARADGRAADAQPGTDGHPRADHRRNHRPARKPRCAVHRGGCAGGGDRPAGGDEQRQRRQAQEAHGAGDRHD